jgi:HAD superfamily hydrolase (TIGR01509 family)
VSFASALAQDIRPVADTEAVIFDYGQTLVTFSYPREELLEVVRNFRPTIEEAIAGPAPAAEFILEEVLLPMERFVSSQSQDEVRWLEVFGESWRQAGIALPDGLLYEIVDAEQQCWDRVVEVDPHARPVLTALRERGLRLAVCSNAPFPPETMRRQLVTNGIANLVDGMVFSSEVGRRKPAPEIYRAALAAVAATPQQAFFVGNSVREDYDGPRSLGMRAVICTAHNHEPVGPGVATISTLDELVGLL